MLVNVYPEEGGGPALDVYTADHLPLGNSVEVATVVLTAPDRAPTDAELAPQRALHLPLGPLSLVGLDQPVSTVNSGDPLPLTFYWRVTTPPTTALLARLDLQGADGTVATLGTFVPGPAWTVGAAWTIGAAWRLPRDFIVPPTLPTGMALLRLVLTDASGQNVLGQAELGPLQVIAPQRQFAIPAMRVRRDWQVGTSFRLLGFDREPLAPAPGQTLAVKLYWQSVAITDQAYKVFVHLLDANGQIVAQRDAVPRDGTRPTTSWLPGEVITDEYPLALPADLAAGTYTLQVGMYNTLTQERLPMLDNQLAPAGDNIALEQFSLSRP